MAGASRVPTLWCDVARLCRISEVHHQWAFQIRASKLMVVQDAEGSRKGGSKKREEAPAYVTCIC